MRMLLEGDDNLMDKEEDSEVVAAVLVASWKRDEIMLETQFSETLGLAPLRGDLSCRSTWSESKRPLPSSHLAVTCPTVSQQHSQTLLHLSDLTWPDAQVWMVVNARNIHNTMAPSPIHVHDHISHIEKHDGWGIHAGRLPMYSPVWTNDKGWASRLASDFSSSLGELPVRISRYLPFSHGQWWRGGGKWQWHLVPPIFFSFYCAVFGILLQPSRRISAKPSSINSVTQLPSHLSSSALSPAVRFTRMRMPTRAILRSTFPMGLFQVGGLFFSSIAISRIPVSTVHTFFFFSKFATKFLSYLTY